MDGKHLKLLIAAFSDAKFLVPTGEVFETLVNPDSYREQFSIDYSEAQAIGASAANLKYKSTRPRVIGFTFLFDGTGVIPATSIGSAVDKVLPVFAQIEWFKRVVFDFDGNIHSPRFVRIIWGPLMFKGRLASLSIDYTLFSPNGMPLRARATAEFKGSIEPFTRALLERTSSPDLTHTRVVAEGDRLPNLSNEIYRSPNHYLEIARANNLTSCRRLKPGASLVFPPFAK